MGVISNNEWTEDDPYPEKFALGDGDCSSRSIVAGTYLGMYKWGLHHEPYHTKYNCLCHGFVRILYSQPDTVQYREQIARTDDEVSEASPDVTSANTTSPKIDCSQLRTEQVNVSRQRYTFIKIVREVYNAAKYMRVSHCSSPENAAGHWTQTTTFDWGQVSAVVERGKIANAAINFLQNIAYTHSFSLE